MNPVVRYWIRLKQEYGGIIAIRGITSQPATHPFIYYNAFYISDGRTPLKAYKTSRKQYK